MTQPDRHIRFEPPSLSPVADSHEPARRPVRSADADTGEVRKLATLVDVSQSLSATVNFQAGLQAVLEVLDRRCGALRGAVVIADETSGELELRGARGLPSTGRPVRWKLGEGLPGRVAAEGKPVVVERAAGQPPLGLAEGYRGAADDAVIYAVPVQLHRRTVGALALELRRRADRDHDRMLKFLRIVASMISQAVRIQRLLEADRRRLLDENSQLRQALHQRYELANVVGTSGPMRQVYEQVAQVAGTNTTVVIRGESGTGKELIALALHHHSPRAARPFVRVNCAALPETLLESELFGHERGAFTGAVARKRGRFEQAHGGTLLLDEVGELSPAAQAKLLRVLQEREFERVGGSETIRVDVRILAATNRHLESAVANGSFREDLYYRLNVFGIFVPPLRERKSDVLLLADHFVEKYARLHGTTIKRISTPAIDMLMAYHWPGNVRELENTIERAVVVSDSEVIHAHHLPPTLQTAEASGTTLAASLAEAVGGFETSLIQDALKSTRGNRAEAARLLNSTERIINYKVKRYGIDWQRFRA